MRRDIVEAGYRRGGRKGERRKGWREAHFFELASESVQIQAPLLLPHVGRA